MEFNDEELRKNILERKLKEKNTEDDIKNKLEDIKFWYEVESELIEEKQKILRIQLKELNNEKQIKIKNLHLSYEPKMINQIMLKYNIRI